MFTTVSLSTTYMQHFNIASTIRVAAIQSKQNFIRHKFCPIKQTKDDYLNNFSTVLVGYFTVATAAKKSLNESEFDKHCEA